MSCCTKTEDIKEFVYGPCGHSQNIEIPLSRGLTPGMVLHAVASTTDKTSFNIFDVNRNYLLHVNPRIQQKVIVFNSHFGKWGQEERPKEMPIKSGVKYSIHIAFELEGYRIFIDGEHFYFYRHRCSNPAALFTIHYGQTFYVSYKLNKPRWAIQESARSMYVQDFSSCLKSTPHEIKLDGPSNLEWIIITGLVNCDATRFDINFINSKGEIVFHFNPRFNENNVVRNSYLNTVGWGKEERCGKMLFQRNQKFTLAFVVEMDCYRIYINGEEFDTYKHRTPFQTITKCEIVKDVKIQKVMYQK